mmetsp:Transcript_24888/g.37984  ORF Transcript_24888/g.37984 Transcript_24888/m.37984 type:complete len:228 (+) Transcript_24888:331-1014(+)
MNHISARSVILIALAAQIEPGVFAAIHAHPSLSPDRHLAASIAAESIVDFKAVFDQAVFLRVGDLRLVAVVVVVIAVVSLSLLVLLLLLVFLLGSFNFHLVIAVIHLELLGNFGHDIDIPPRSGTSFVKLEAFFHLFSKFFAVQATRFVREGIDTGGNGTFVGQVSRYPSLVLGFRSSNKGGVVDQAVLGGVSLRLEGAEQRLFGSQNLNCGCRGLGQVCQGSSLAD